MKNFTRFLLSLAGTVLFLTMAHAQTLTITDEQAPHAAITRFGSVSTTLSATVQDAPTSNAEIEVTGPTYRWSGDTEWATLNTRSGASVQLHISPPTVPGVAIPQHEGGENSVTISCVATYSVRNRRDSSVSSIPASGEKEVEFFVRVPVSVRQVDYSQAHPQLGMGPYYGVVLGDFKYWGDWKRYRLRVMDNRDGGYGFGSPEEEFVNVQAGPQDPDFFPNMDDDGNPVNNTVFNPTQEGLFYDFNSVLIPYSLDTAPATIPDRVLGSADQKWWLRESGDRKHIDTHHLIYQLYDVSRSGG